MSFMHVFLRTGIKAARFDPSIASRQDLSFKLSNTQTAGTPFLPTRNKEQEGLYAQDVKQAHNTYRMHSIQNYRNSALVTS